jgi:hypothetical protein
MQVSRGDLVLHLSSHHDDGTPGARCSWETQGVDAPARRASRAWPPLPESRRRSRLGGDREMQLIDPASNRLRLYERRAST